MSVGMDISMRGWCAGRVCGVKVDVGYDICWCGFVGVGCLL